MSEFMLTSEIIARSKAKEWDTAKGEWSLGTIIEANVAERCLCGHYPIKKVCVLKNTTTQHTARVGNCCVKKFIGLPSDLIFQALKRIKEDNNKSLNIEAIEYAHDKGWINDWEKKFYVHIMRKQKLSRPQANSKIKINLKVISLSNKTQHSEVVGNGSVEKFTGSPSDLIFQGLERIKENSNNSLNIETIEFAHDKSWINDWEKNFYINVMSKQKLSRPQATNKIKINLKVISYSNKETA